MSKYLKPAYFIDYNHPLIKKKIKELFPAKKNQTKTEQAIKLFYFVRDEIKYRIVIEKGKFSLRTLLWFNMRASKILKLKEGFCFPKAALLVALARSLGIKARLHFVDIINHQSPENLQKIMGGKTFLFHAYAEFFLEGKWVKATPAFDKELCKRKGYPVVDFDGEHDAIFPPFNAQGERFVDYINDHGFFPSIPYFSFCFTYFKNYVFSKNKRLK